MEQMIRPEVQKSAPKAVDTTKKQRGRPKGSKNKNQEEVDFSPFQTQMSIIMQNLPGIWGKRH
jgi:hypothetical protein